MGRGLLCVYLLVFVVFFKEASCVNIRIQNKLLGKCLQVLEGPSGSRVSLGDCRPGSVLQEWHWLPEGHALSSRHTGECLSASGEQYEGVQLQLCVSGATGGGGLEVDTSSSSSSSSQAWSCSKRGHLSLMGRGLHLSATPQSTLVFLSREHKQGSRWRTLDNETLCDGRESKHEQHQLLHHLGNLEFGVFPNASADMHRQAEPIEVTVTNPVLDELLSISGTRSPKDPTMLFFSMDYGMGWKITMLVLSSLALVLGTVILILNVYSNRRKKVVCVLKSYSPRPERSAPGSPVPSERAPLTENAMCLPHSSPTLHRGEILIEWKDGSVTPLYEA